MPVPTLEEISATLENHAVFSVLATPLRGAPQSSESARR